MPNMLKFLSAFQHTCKECNVLQPLPDAFVWSAPLLPRLVQSTPAQTLLMWLSTPSQDLPQFLLDYNMHR